MLSTELWCKPLQGDNQPNEGSKAVCAGNTTSSVKRDPRPSQSALIRILEPVKHKTKLKRKRKRKLKLKLHPRKLRVQLKLKLKLCANSKTHTHQMHGTHGYPVNEF